MLDLQDIRNAAARIETEARKIGGAEKFFAGSLLTKALRARR